MRRTSKDQVKFSVSTITALTLLLVAAGSPLPALSETTKTITKTTTKTKVIEVKPVAVQTTMMQKGYISSALSPVRLAGEDVFTITEPAGGFTAEERSIIIERNLNNALISSKDRTPNAVEIVVINHLPVIRVGGKHVLTVDSNLAAAYHTPMFKLAGIWAGNMKKALSDQAKVDNYVAQLGGDWIYSPYSPPYRRAQWTQARLNHASKEARQDLPLDLVCSAGVRDDGFEEMMKRDPVAAEVLFRKSLAMEPGNQRAHYGLGCALLKQGKVDEALAELDMARWLDHDDAQVHLALGEALESKGLDTAALVRYREASLLHPEDPTPALFIADMRETRDDIGRSVRELTEAANNCPQSDYLRLRRKDQIGWRLVRPF